MDKPREKKLRIAPFALHAARGVIRDQNTRRKAMFVAVIVAVVMLFCGATLLAPMLDAHTRPGWFVFYWLICAWVTITALLLAIFDLLLLRARGRAVRRRLKEEFSQPASSDRKA